MSSYGNRTKNQQEVIQNIIRNEIGYCQSALVDMLLQRGDVEGFTVDDIQGMYVDPSEWDWDQIQEFSRDEGIELPEWILRTEIPAKTRDSSTNAATQSAITQILASLMVS